MWSRLCRAVRLHSGFEKTNPSAALTRQFPLFSCGSAEVRGAVVYFFELAGEAPGGVGQRLNEVRFDGGGDPRWILHHGGR
jgi:hypothetical protein